LLLLERHCCPRELLRLLVEGRCCPRELLPRW
jgi:hypothetical protein